MKKLILFLSLASVNVMAQVPTNVQKLTPNITADLNIGVGRILSINGGTFNGSGLFDFSVGTVDLPSTVSVNAATITIPTSTDTLIGRATTDTLTNKIWNGIPIGITYAGAPTGGATGQALIKNSNSNYDYSWTSFGGVSGLTTNGAVYATSATSIGSTSGLTNGQLLIGSTGVAPVAATITGTANQLTVTNGAGTVTLSVPTSFLTSTLPSGTPAVLVSATTQSLTTINLTAGDWLVQGIVYFAPDTTTNVTRARCGVSAVAATLPGLDSGAQGAWGTAGVPGVQGFTVNTIQFHVNVPSGTQTEYLVAEGAFTVSFLNASGTIQATRIP